MPSRGRGSRHRMVVLASAAAAATAIFAPASPAGASTAVSNVTVAVASPSSAAGALTTYKVGFKTSASGALSGDTGSTITIVLAHRNRPDQPDEQLPSWSAPPKTESCAGTDRTTSASCFLYSGMYHPGQHHRRRHAQRRHQPSHNQHHRHLEGQHQLRHAPRPHPRPTPSPPRNSRVERDCGDGVTVLGGRSADHLQGRVQDLGIRRPVR